MSNARPYLLHCRSALHVGCGISLGDIDLPVMRNVVTGHPMVPGSAIKGCVKKPAKAAWGLDENSVRSLFGAEGNNATGMLCPQDAQLLALPVASLAGGWAWATSSTVLHNLLRRLRQCGATAAPAVPEPSGDAASDIALVATGSPLVFQWASQRRAAFADIALQPQEHAALASWATWIARNAYPGDAHWQGLFASRFIVVSDDVFDHFSRLGTDVRSRNSIGDDGVSDDKCLWREECVPEDALFYGTVSAQSVPANPARLSEDRALALVASCAMQVGGKASIGYGFIDFIPLAAGSAPEQAP